MLEPISENIIKKVALRFFRNHYKFRLRRDDQPAVAKYDLNAEGDIIADGYYSFRKTDGSTFVATFEATTLESKKEVLFQAQQKVKLWDSLAFAAMVSTSLLALNFLFSVHELDEREILTRIILLVLAFIGSLATFYFFAGTNPRYRYIYAIEQFKKYHADEQWIALAYDVFDNSNDPYFAELRKQCAKNGFGLLIVEQNLDTKIVITPSRHDVFKGKRQVIDFSTQAKKVKDVSISFFSPVFEFLGLQLYSPPKGKPTLNRFRKTFYHQMLFVASCVAIGAAIIWQELQFVGFKTIEPSEYRSSLAISQSNNVREQEEFLGDSASTPKRKKATENFWEKSVIPEKKNNPTPSPTKNLEKPKDTLSRRKDESFHIYDCSRYSGAKGTYYIIAEGEYATLFHTKTRLRQLFDKNLECGALRQDCFGGRKPGFLVYLGFLYEDKAEASQKLAELSKDTEFKNHKLELLTFIPSGK